MNIPFFTKTETSTERQERVSEQKDAFEFAMLVREELTSIKEGEYNLYQGKEASNDTEQQRG